MAKRSLPSSHACFSRSRFLYVDVPTIEQISELVNYGLLNMQKNKKKDKITYLEEIAMTIPPTQNIRFFLASKWPPHVKDVSQINRAGYSRLRLARFS